MNRTNLFLDGVKNTVSVAVPNDFHIHERVAEFRYILGKQQSPNIYDVIIDTIKKQINDLMDEHPLIYTDMSTGHTKAITNGEPILERLRLIDEIRLLKSKDGK